MSPHTTHRSLSMILALNLLVAGIASAAPKHIKVKVEEKLNEGLQPPPKGLDRSTPNRAWSAFIRNCRSGRWELAAHVLNLGDIPAKDQKALGAAAAQKLCQVLKKTEQLSASGLPDSAIGPLSDDQPTNYVVTAKVEGPEGREEAWLRRTRDQGSGKEVWTLTRRTISQIDGWYRWIIKRERGEPKVAMINEGLGALPGTYKLQSPRATATKFLELVRAGNYADAARLLDLRRVPAKRQRRRGTKLARRLALVLDRLKPGFDTSLSNDLRGAPEKGVPGDEERVLVTKIDGRSITVHMVRLRRSSAPAVWVFSAGTVANIDLLYGKHGYGFAGDYLPPLFFNVQLWQIQLWQWIGLILGLILVYILGRMAAFFTRKLMLRAARFTKWQWDDKLVEATRGPLTLLYGSLGFLVVIGLLSFAAAPQQLGFRLVKLLAIVAVGWFAVRVVDVAGEVVLEIFRERQDDMGMAMVPVARKIAKPIMVLLVGIVALQNIGVNVAGLLAGLGIGGLALAMASKTTVENMLGGITIAFDRPFKVGDFIKVGDLLGGVEEVGLRSTRVRTLDRTVVTIPNGQMADSRIENFAKRDNIRLLFTIGVQYDSSIDQLRLIIDEIKRLWLATPELVADGFRVRFSNFGDSALEIEVVGYVDTTDYNVFTAVREGLFIKIADIVTAAGAEFAFPSRTIYTGKASAADGKKAKKAAELVERRLRDGELTIPEVPETVRDLLLAERTPAAATTPTPAAAADDADAAGEDEEEDEQKKKPHAGRDDED